MARVITRPPLTHFQQLTYSTSKQQNFPTKDTIEKHNFISAWHQQMSSRLFTGGLASPILNTSSHNSVNIRILKKLNELRHILQRGSSRVNKDPSCISYAIWKYQRNEKRRISLYKSTATHRQIQFS